MLDSGDVDAIVICGPHYLQMDIAALQCGVHDLLEKPAGVLTKQAKELNAFTTTESELTVAIVFNQRNNPL
jgi:predicted dehydrogenase